MEDHFLAIKKLGMKKLWIILLLTGSLLACNNDNASENKKTIVTPEAEHQEQKEDKGDLILNNGAKWKADSSTNENVKSLLAIIEAFNGNVDKSLTAYTDLSNDLQQGLNKMINDCKMQGPDHEALHKWLEPVIDQVSKLKQASSAVNATALFEAIQAQVKLYPQYFE